MLVKALNDGIYLIRAKLDYLPQIYSLIRIKASGFG
jgi:hypothetical protein